VPREAFKAERSEATFPSPSRRDRMPDGFVELATLLQTGADLFAGQLGLLGQEPISRQAGQMLLDHGVVPSLDEGIALFHVHITRGKPGLRRTLRKVDAKAGRLHYWARHLPKRNGAARAVATAVAAGEVVRRKNGQIAGLSPRAKRIVAGVRKAGAAQVLLRAERQKLRNILKLERMTYVSPVKLIRQEAAARKRIKVLEKRVGSRAKARARRK